MNLIKFKRDTAFRKQFFVPGSFSHPAKMDAQLLLWIVEHYTEAGETILDPMFGSGTTMLACMLGRNVIGVELEQKFVDMAKANWEKVRQKPQLGSSMGTCQIIQGDARQLENILCDKIITSPPFCEQSDFRLHGGLKDASNKGVIAHKFGGKNNIGNLPYGQVDKIVTSPPYADSPGTPSLGSVNKDDWGNEGKDIVARRGLERGYSKDTENQIGNLPYGQVDKIVTSPPYEGSLQGEPHNGLKDAQKLEELTKENPNRKWKRKTELTPGRMRAWGTMGLGYTERVDSIITSPPYEGSATGKEGGGIDWSRSKEFGTGNKATGMASEYSATKDNIGNLKSDSYLSAMLQVYQQCFHVLRPGGLCILITKNFIRNQKEVRLDLDTISLCEQAGFTFQERWYRELSAQSFWRIIYKKKYPDAPELKYEDVLIFARCNAP